MEKTVERGRKGNVELILTRNTGHPWDSRPGFDTIEMEAPTREELEAYISGAKKMHWYPWFVGIYEGTGRAGGLIYKPCDQMVPWDDTLKTPALGRVRVDDEVVGAVERRSQDQQELGGETGLGATPH